MRLTSDCNRCRLRQKATQVVWGDGPPNAQVILIGEAPGQEEDHLGIPFVGRSGETLEGVLLRPNGLWREDCYITNTVKCRPPGNRDPKADEVRACRRWLRRELELLTDARVITLVGRTVTRSFLGDVDMERVHGLVYAHPDYDAPLLPVYHPAAGLHSPEMMTNIIQDFKVLGALAKGTWSGTVRDLLNHESADCWPSPDYRKVAGAEEVARDLLAAPWVAVDTEAVPLEGSSEEEDLEWADGQTRDGRTWSLQYATAPGTGRMIMADDADSCKQFGEIVAQDERVSPLVVLHNSLYDLGALSQVGIDPSRIADTMIMAYLLQDEPQGLKPLAYRHAGMLMDSYWGLVGQEDDRLALEYLQRVVDYPGGWPKPKKVLQWVKGEPKVKQPQDVGQKAKRAIRDHAKNPAKVSPRKRWTNIGLDEGRLEVERVLGPMPKASLQDVAEEDALHYACRDADATARVYPVLWKRIQEEDLEHVFWRDMGVVPMVDDMMRNGMKVDLEALSQLDAKLTASMEELEQKISEVAEERVNPGSPPQVAKLLYDKLKLRVPKRTPGGDRSTDTKALVRLRDDHPLVGELMEWRQLQKLRDSFARTLPKHVDPRDGRVHTTLRITRVATGRLASSSPNLMAQPVRTEMGRYIRDCFVAEDEYVLVSDDYSQVEMRLTAHDSGDPELTRIFLEGLDIHSQTASKMFGIPVDQLDEMKHRYPAKRVGFGILNDISAAGLQREMVVGGADEADWPISLCEQLIEQWFGVYSGVRTYMDRNRNYAKRFLEVRDIWGRKRLIPGVKSLNPYKREDAYRQAGNGPIQMGAQGIIKEAMRRLVPKYRGWNREAGKAIVRPLIQIHDDIVWEIHKGVLGELLPEILYIMEHCTEGAIGADGKEMDFRVPLKVDAKVGERWGSLGKWERP